MTSVQTIQLCDFVSKNTLKLFIALDIPQDFLNQHPSTWENNKSFVDGRIRVQKLKVVNDAAERGISLVQHSMGYLLTRKIKSSIFCK